MLPLPSFTTISRNFSSKKSKIDFSTMPQLKYVLRQWYVMGCMGLQQVVYGFALAFPAIIAPTLAQDDSDIRADDALTSWFLTSCGIVMPISYVLLPATMQIYGRKCAFTLANFSFFIGCMVIARASDITNLIIGRAILGLAYASVLVNCIMVAEYTHPKRRSFFMVFRMFTSYGGLLIGHYFGSKLAWRQLAWISTALTSLSIIGTLKLPESPAWLAYEERYDDCSRSFKYMRGEDTKAINELNELIAAQRKLREGKSDYGTGIKATLISCKSKEFLKVMMTSVISLTLYETSGCNFIIVNLVTIMTKMTGDQSTAYYFTMGFDVVRIISVAFSAVLVRVFNRKTLLIYSAGIAYSILFLVCVFYYNTTVTGNLRMKWLAPAFMLLFEAVCSSGLYSIIMILQCEIYPLKFRGVGITIAGFVLGLGDASTSKLTPLMFQTIGIHGTFGVYLVISIILLPILFYLLPETKNKSLQEIENNFVNLKSDKPKCIELRTLDAVPLIKN